MPDSVCLTCGGRVSSDKILVREMMYGSRDVFPYSTCMDCNSIQLAKFLSAHELEKFYGSDYYSFQTRDLKPISKTLQTYRDMSVFGSGNAFQRLIGTVVRQVKGGKSIWIIPAAGVKPWMRILDVGCGAGHGMERLYRAGFTKISGVDPFIENDMETPSGVLVQKKFLHEIDGTFDLIIFNHSLEHVPNPAEVLRQAADRLQERGLCMIRIPTPSSEAWEVYRENWVQIDAPRHVFLPSREGMKKLAERTGFELEKEIDDSTMFQFSGSELYKMDIPLLTEISGTRSPTPITEIFSARELRAWQARSKALNTDNRGDQTTFLLRRAVDH